MKHLSLIILMMLGAAFPLSAESAYTDSLRQVWQDPSIPDTSRLQAIQVLTQFQYKQNELDSTQFYGLQMLKKAQEVQLISYQAFANRYIGESLMDAGQLDEAIPYLREGVRLWAEAGNLPKAGNIYNLLGLIFRRQGVQDSALNAYEQAIDAFGRARDSSKMGILYKNLAAVYTEKGDIQKSLELNRQSLELNQRFGTPKRIAASHQNLGIAYSRMGDIAHAIDEYQQALTILEDLGPSRGLINLYYSLANVYIEMEDMTQAEFFFMKGIRMADSSKSIQNQAFAKTSMASWYLDIEKYPEALGSFEEALDFITENQFMVLLSTVQAGKGQALFELGRLAEAEKWLKDALTTSLENGRAYQIIQSYLFLSRIAWEKGNVNLAGTYAENGLVVAQEIQELTMTVDLAEMLVNVQKKRGNYAEALRMRELAIAMRDSANTEEKKRAALRL
ncbi:MAG: tetratricopeptide repeat protein [Bacteroidota bacterium]